MNIEVSQLAKTLFFCLLALFFVFCGSAAMVIYLIKHRVEGKYFDSNGVRIHYNVEGEGEPVVLIHGFAVNGDINWRLPGITEALKKNFRVITMDLRGHGLSDKPHDATQYGLEMVKDILRLLERLEIKRAHLVGYSLGGFIVLKLASTLPERLISAAVLGAGWEPADNNTFEQALFKIADSLESGKTIGPISGHLGPKPRKPSLVHTWGVKIMTGYFNDKMALAAMIRSIPKFAPSEESLQNISVPLCIIVGSLDPFKSSAEAMAGRLKDYQLIIVERADHIRTLTRKETLDSLRRFLIQHWGRWSEQANNARMAHSACEQDVRDEMSGETKRSMEHRA